MARQTRKSPRKLVVLSLFDGLGGARIALDRLGIPCEYYASEVDRNSIKVSSARYPDIIHLGDVQKIKAKDLPPVDLLIGGTPCTDVSNLNRGGKGLDGDQSGLFFDFVRIRDVLEPTYFVMENVHCTARHEMSRHVGVDPVPINSDRFVPQHRPRLYWTNLMVPAIPIRPRWNLRFVQCQRGSAFLQSTQGGTSPAVTTHNRGFNIWFQYTGDDEHWPIRRMRLEQPADSKDFDMPKWLKWPDADLNEILQGLPPGYTKLPGMSERARMKMIGNGFTIPVIQHLLSPLKSVYS